MKSDIKIFVSCHKKSILADNPLLYPVQVGAALADSRLPGMYHDDEGDNISAKNRKYCELTAQYWAWKNMDADYYGFFHYRRYMNFSDRRYRRTTMMGEVACRRYDEEAAQKFAIDEARMREVIESCDVILTKPVISYFNYIQYALPVTQNGRDLKFCLKVIDEEFPYLSKVAHRYLFRLFSYHCNMFVMKKEIFDDYNKFLFRVLQRFDEEIACDEYPAQKYRVSGYLAERLCGIYYLWLRQNKSLRIRELQRTFFFETDPLQLPAYDPDWLVNIAVRAQAQDAPKLSVLLASLARAADPAKRTRVILLDEGLPAGDRARLLGQCKSAPHLRLETLSLPLYADVKHRRVTAESLKFLLPELLPDFGVVLYLDGTFLVRKDPAELIKQDVPALAAVRDLTYDCAHRYAANSPDLQSGIPAARMLVLNLPALRRRWRPEQVESLVRDRRARFAGEMLAALVPDWTLLPLEAALPFDRYGLLTKRVYGCAPHFVNDAYLAARKSPQLVDLSDWSLPLDVSADFADEFWKIARETPFYERLLVEAVRGKPDRRDLRTLRRKARLAKWAPPFSYRRTVLATFLKDL